MIVATAGHIDHGKTSLVRALSGVDADRLPEEKRRGMTIDLGFAYIDTPQGGRIGFVDVPGHEKFVRTMLAGVAGVDFALLVVAADDGVMPQTREHLAILNLLEAPAGAVAITKQDMVEPERLAEVEAEIRLLLEDGPLADVPMFPLSSITGDGVDALRQRLFRSARELARPAARGKFRLAVDRSFQLRGAGLVITGTAYAGRIKAGDRVIVAPGGKEARVRGMHAQNQESHAGRDGERLAINLAGINADDISRGDWLIEHDGLAASSKLDVLVRAAPEALDGKGLKDGQAVHLHHGASDIPARILLLETRRLEPGEQGFGRITLDRSTSAAAFDRFVLRDHQGQATLAGGRILDPDPPGRRWRQRMRFEALNHAEPTTALAALLAEQPVVPWTEFSRARNLSDSERATVLRGTDHVQMGEGASALLAAPARVAALEAAVLQALEGWHQANKKEPGAAPVALRRLLGDTLPPVPLFEGVVQRLKDAKKLIRASGRLALPGHSVRFSDQEERIWRKIEPLLEDGGLRPPRVRELAEEVSVDHKLIETLLKRAARMGLLAEVSANRFFPPAAIEDLMAIAKALTTANPDQGFTAKEFRDRSGIGRNVSIEVLEYMDKAGLTRRKGDSREVV